MTQAEEQSLPEIIASAHGLLDGSDRDIEEARLLCIKALELDPSNANAAFILAQIALRVRRFEIAISLGEELLRRNPGIPVVNNLIGCACYERGSHDEAKIFFQAALEKDGANAGYLRNLANTEIHLGNFETAVELVQKALQSAPEDGASFLALGVALSKLGRMQEAIEAYRGAIKFSPDSHHAFKNLAFAQNRYGNAFEAETNYRSAIKLYPEYLDARFNLARLLRDQGRLQEALDELMRIAAIDTDYPDVLRAISYGQQMLDVAENAKIRAKDAAPLFILAPARCCGSGLLRRAVSIAGGIVLFDESADLSRRLPECVSFALSKAHHKELIWDGQEELNQSWDMAGFFPGDGKTYLSHTLEAFYSVVALYQGAAEGMGRRWGMEAVQSGQVGQLRNLLPFGKFVFLYRNLFEIARSYKTRGWLETEFDTIKLAHDWQDEISLAFQCGEKNMLMVRYEELAENPKKILERIGRFAGIQLFDHAAVVTGIDELSQDGGRCLLQHEIDILMEYASPMLQVLEYACPNE